MPTENWRLKEVGLWLSLLLSLVHGNSMSIQGNDKVLSGHTMQTWKEHVHFLEKQTTFSKTNELMIVIK